MSSSVLAYDPVFSHREKQRSFLYRLMLEQREKHYGTRAFDENPSALSGPDSAPSADRSAARRQFVGR
jgi:hypothetical protein